MKKLLGITASATLIALTSFAPQPAYALPTCEQEVRIRCHGYDVQGRPRLDEKYNSPEECMAAEQPLRCGTEYDPYASLDQLPLNAILRKERVLAA